MADRGFNISDDLAVIGAHLEIPASTQGKKQLSMSEVEKTRHLAKLRLHVEKVVGIGAGTKEKEGGLIKLRAKHGKIFYPLIIFMMVWFN